MQSPEELDSEAAQLEKDAEILEDQGGKPETAKAKVQRAKYLLDSASWLRQNRAGKFLSWPDNGPCTPLCSPCARACAIREVFAKAAALSAAPALQAAGPRLHSVRAAA